MAHCYVALKHRAARCDASEDDLASVPACNFDTRANIGSSGIDGTC